MWLGDGTHWGPVVTDGNLGVLNATLRDHPSVFGSVWEPERIERFAMACWRQRIAAGSWGRIKGRQR